jgi:hypothetical protein
MNLTYQDFIIEKEIKSLHLILESVLSSSSPFLNKLKLMKGEKGVVGDIAKEIYRLFVDERWLDGVKQNFFDVTDKSDLVSFFMQGKLPDDYDEDEDPSLPYNIKGRGEMKIGKFIKYILKIADDEISFKPKDKDIEAFVNVYKSISDKSEFEFKLVSGSDISKYYNSGKYFSSHGSLGNSCMAEESKTTFRLYADNPDEVRLLILVDKKTDKISGRSLVWKLSESPCKAKYFMDRIYTNSDSDFYKFRKFAEENKFLYKAFQSSSVETNVIFKYKGETVLGEIKVELDASWRSYPFVDTLCFVNEDRNELSNLPDYGSEWLHTLNGEIRICEDCEGDLIAPWKEGSDKLCDNCCSGHLLLKSKGVKNKINKIIK